MRDLQELLAHPAQLVSHIKAMRADGDFQGAAALLREAQHQDPSDSEIRGLLAQTQLDIRFCDEKRAWLALVSETRELVEKHVERGELTEAHAVLTGVERRHGAVEELEELKERLQGLRCERELAELASHLGEAQRLRDEGYLQESVWEARQALALDPQNREATMLADSLVLEIEERELAVAVRRDATRIGALLGRGRLVRAGLLIRNSQRKYGNLPALQGQLQRRRRLRTTRWAGRWNNVSHTAEAPALWIRRRLEERGKARTRVLVAKLREQKKARLALVSETRARIEEHLEREELAEAQTVLARVESQNGAIEELEDLKERLVVLCREKENAKQASHLGEADRLRDEDQLQESLGEARQALALDPQDREATTIVDSLIVEIEGRELAAATQRDATRIDVLLERGRLLRAELWIKNSLRKYGSLPVFRDQLQRCRRLKATRWAKRRALASHTAGAPALWIRQRVEERGEARTRARLELVSETRSRIEDHVDRGEFIEAQTVLRQAESRQGAIEELDDWRVYLQTVHAQWESEKLASHLSEARRLHAEDRFQDSLGEARRALTIDPQNGEATHLVESLVSQLQERELAAAAPKDAARIDVLLSQGNLGRAELLIGSYRRKYGDLPSAQHQLRRCRRLRAVRWAGRGAKLQEWVRAIPVDRIRAFPVAAVTQLAGALADQVKPRLEKRSIARKWVLVASFSLIVVATAGAYLVDFHFQRGTGAFSHEEIAAGDLEPDAAVAPSGDLILDALPWGRVVAIVGKEGEQQDLGDSLFTPVRRSLPAGSYRVVMENPTVEEPAEFWVQVYPSGITTKVHEFEPFDADAYFGRAGWQESGS